MRFGTKIDKSYIFLHLVYIKIIILLLIVFSFVRKFEFIKLKHGVIKMDELNKNKEQHKNRIFIGIFIIFFLIAGISGISIAQKIKKMHDGGPLLFMMEKITKDLNLTEQQKTDIDKIKEEIKIKMGSRKKNRQSGMDDFANAFKQDKLDKETLKAIEQKHESDRQEMKDFLTDELIKFHDILTPEQRSQVVEKMKELREKGNELFKKHHDRRFEIPPENN
jgi:Spy/CpxP family protein refolding chaperone